MVTMPIVSRAYEVWERLYARYSLEPGAPPTSPPQLATWILPTTSADELLKAATGAIELTAISGNGVVAVATVPQGERWTLKSMFVSVASGLFNIEDFRLYDSSEDVAPTIEIWTASTSHRVDPAVWPLTLNEYDEIRCQISSFSNPGNLQCDLWYDEEKAF